MRKCSSFPAVHSARDRTSITLRKHRFIASQSTGSGWIARRVGVTSMVSLNLPLWIRFVLLVGVIGLASGASLLAYRYYTRPVTLSVAVGSIDGEAAQAMSAIASHPGSPNAPGRVRASDSGTALEAAKAFAAGNVALAVVRGDVGDLSQARAVVVISHMVVLIVAPP